ncbi:type IV pilus/biofilm regulator FimL [Simiduia litorea]|uniref:pilus assembly protein n=1 Tax=Simiduia litorea TaxID=1435348 RepID=UPI0036F2753B
MSSNTINLSSLKLVREELLATIEASAAKLEQFVADRDNGDLLQGCIDGIKQISGTLSVVQLKGADLLAQEILALAQEITTGENNEADEYISTLTSSFFILPRYLEYVQQTKRNLPVLLVPAINEMRQVRKAALLKDSHFFEATVSIRRGNPGQTTAVMGEDISALARRLRHMYQVGFLAVLQGKQIKPSLGMMQRSLERLDIISSGRPLGKLWWLGAVAIGVIAQKSMELSRSRKMLLSTLDRELKKLQQNSAKSLDTEPDPELMKDLLYVIAVSGVEDPKLTALLTQCQVQPLGYTDTELRREREALKGPSANTITSMVSVLKDELNSVKDVLERAAQAGNWADDENDELVSTLVKIAEILAVVGLVSASNTLKQEIERISAWKAADKAPSTEEFLEVADSLLYVESTVSGVGSLNLSDDQLARINSGSRSDIIATSQLAEAEKLVFQEAEAGLSMIKRALSSYSESGFDRGHIKNVSTTLATIRGGMGVIGLKRAASVTAACQSFVAESLQSNEHPEMLQQMLETFADAVIGLEYYLDAAKSDKSADDNVLQIAEESLAALGHPVH